jgi:hypothetical protein
MTALPPKADVVRHNRDVRFVPKADSCNAADGALFDHVVVAQPTGSLAAQVSPVGTIAAVSTINMMLFSGARVQCITPFGPTKP